ncbi:MAG: DUF2798 domain-containing protein [Lachnospiraceae bacterium]|nr:DUF2798 domain-containing protein [Lachnospiraceae bacterium]
MPKTKLQEFIFTILMVITMVYTMICYNIALNIGGLWNHVFLEAFHELILMGPIAFILDFFIVAHIATKKAFAIVDMKKNHPFMLVLAISSISVAFMCPLISLAATILFKNAGNQIFAVWLQTTVFNFPMAFFAQIFFVGPLVRFIFGKIVKVGVVSAN